MHVSVHLGNAEAFSEQLLGCFELPRTLQCAVWFDRGV